MDQDTHGRNMGRIVKTAEELGRAVKEELETPSTFSAQRKAAAQHIFHEPGTAARRMANRLMELAGAKTA